MEAGRWGKRLGWAAALEARMAVHRLTTLAHASHCHPPCLPTCRLQTAATLVDPGSGRGLHILTTAPAVIVYTGNYLDDAVRGKGGAEYAPHSGVAIEVRGRGRAGEGGRVCTAARHRPAAPQQSLLICRHAALARWPPMSALHATLHTHTREPAHMQASHGCRRWPPCPTRSTSRGGSLMWCCAPGRCTAIKRSGASSTPRRDARIDAPQHNTCNDPSSATWHPGAERACLVSLPRRLPDGAALPAPGVLRMRPAAIPVWRLTR